MNTRKVVIPALPFIVLAATLAMFIVKSSPVASQSATDFFRLRAMVYDNLYERLSTPKEGVTIALPAHESQLKYLTTPFPDEAHIQSVLRGQDWFGGGGFQLLMDLDDSVLDIANQGNSETMTAVVLLNHYFGFLNSLGFRDNDSPAVVMAEVQSAKNEWFMETDRSITISGTVFVSPESKQAIVICEIREWLPKK